MSTIDVSAYEALLEAGAEAGNGSRRKSSQSERSADLRGLVDRARSQPEAVAMELLQSQRQCDLFKRHCAQAAEAAENAAKLLTELLTGHAAQYRLETLRQTTAGLRAVCRVGEHTREFSLHPTVNVEDLRRLEPWEYVCVHENVVIGVWAGEAQMFENARGEVVSFKGYYGGDQRFAQVARLGNQEDVVRLARHLCEQPLSPGCRLVLLRDNPRWAIDSIPAHQAVSRFEVSIDTITTRLSDLACIDLVAEKLLLEIHKRVLRPELREEYDLDALRGMILYSYKPGMGKTAFMRAFAREISDWGKQIGFDVVLYLVKPNELKSMWHGEDARIVRDELFGAIHQRRRVPRKRPLLQLLVMDEIDSLGHRPDGRETVVSSAQSDALEAFLAEADGIQQESVGDPPAYLLMVGMTNRPERLDDAIKRPGRMGDEVVEIPDLSLEDAERVCLIYLRAPGIPWLVDGQVCHGLPADELAWRFVRPALAQVFSAVVLRYASDTQKKFDVTAGQAMAAVHYRKAMAVAKNRAAERRLRGDGVPAVVYDDVVEGLLDTALSVAAQMQTDRNMLVRHLKITVPVGHVDVTPRSELEHHRYVRTT